MVAPYSYDDVKLTCPFCTSEMEFHTLLIDQSLGWPCYIYYVCINGKCQFLLKMDFDEFDKRIGHAPEKVITDGKGDMYRLCKKGPEFLGNIKDKGEKNNAKSQ